jgi:hypothetical protein
MKTRFSFFALLALWFQPQVLLHAATTIDAANRYAYAANLGWLDWRGDTNNGAVVGDYVCSGYIYSANVGWINLGSGTPANGIYYQNVSASDFGVNQDGQGNLTGYAWGANIGWIVFEQTCGQPKVNLFTGQLSGNVWSANCGWISLSNAVASVQTDTITPGALAPDGLPVAWLLSNFGTTNINANADPDHDGVSNQQEYLAGTNPNDATDCLRLALKNVYFGSSYDNDTLAWSSQPSRQYRIQRRSDLATGSWTDIGLLLTPDAGTNTTRVIQFAGPASQRFFRVQAVKPLAP